MSKMIGYARVSTVEQSLALQVSALKAAGCTEIYEEHGVSGAQAERPALGAALAALRSGDTLVVWRLDRLGRSLRHLIDVNNDLTVQGCFFESLTEKIDTSTAMGKFVFHILGAVAELEREIIRERTLAGMAEAAKAGRLPGRPRLAA
ncbi:MAG: recombinase family protein [Pseudomonadota bacterium]